MYQDDAKGRINVDGEAPTRTRNAKERAKCMLFYFYNKATTLYNYIDNHFLPALGGYRSLE